MKLPSYRTTDIRNAFEKMKADKSQKDKTGFIISGKKHINARFYYKGEWIMRTAFSKGRSEIRTGTLNAIRNNLKMNREEFIQFADCPMTIDDLIEIFKSVNLILNNSSSIS